MVSLPREAEAASGAAGDVGAAQYLDSRRGDEAGWDYDLSLSDCRRDTRDSCRSVGALAGLPARALGSSTSSHSSHPHDCQKHVQKQNGVCFCIQKDRSTQLPFTLQQSASRPGHRILAFRHGPCQWCSLFCARRTHTWYDSD